MKSSSYARLSAYLRWADNLILGAARPYLSQDEKLRFWLHHLLNAQEIWLDRLASKTPRRRATELGDDAGLESRFKEAHDQIDHLAGELSKGTDKSITYQNSRQQEFYNSAEDIFLHLINHSTHHRAQIASRIREMGGQPPVTDYIFFCRENP